MSVIHTQAETVQLSLDIPTAPGNRIVSLGDAVSRRSRPADGVGESFFACVIPGVAVRLHGAIYRRVRTQTLFVTTLHREDIDALVTAEASKRMLEELGADKAAELAGLLADNETPAAVKGDWCEEHTGERWLYECVGVHIKDDVKPLPYERSWKVGDSCCVSRNDGASPAVLLDIDEHVAVVRRRGKRRRLSLVEFLRFNYEADNVRP